MNAAIRAVVRTGICRGFETFGVKNGYKGLLEGDIVPLRARDVGGILQRGGTMLGSARSKEFATEPGRARALANLAQHGIDALVVIGGNGSQQGSASLHEAGFPVIGIGSTIDNDLHGADITIGATTALEIVVEAADRLRVTASSHHRAFLIEVMGRNCGWLAMMGGIASGAEAIVIPEAPIAPEDLAAQLHESYARGKPHALVIVAEGAPQDADALAHYFAEHHADLGFTLRATKLGHMQRGGDPCVFDRVLATTLGDAATEYLASGRHGVVLARRYAGIVPTPLAEMKTHVKKLETDRLMALARMLTI
jgi:6-phosphofructokinase 1